MSIPTPVFVALVIAGTGAVVYAIPGLAVGAAYLIGRRRRNARRVS